MLDSPLSPYVEVFKVGKRRWGEFGVEAFFGVIHREFEARWRQEHGEESNAHAIGMLCSNFREFDRVRYIPAEVDQQPYVHAYCDAVEDFLAGFPRDLHALRSVVNGGTMGGRALDGFRVFNNREKTDAFMRFIAHA